MDPLTPLLCEADRRAPPPMEQPIDAEQLRETYGRRAGRRRAAGAAVGAMAAAVLLGGLLMLRHDRTSHAQKTSSDSAQAANRSAPRITNATLLAEIDRLHAEADFHERIVARLRQAESHERAVAAYRAEVARPDVLEPVLRGIDETAIGMLWRGDALHRAAAKAEAERVYEKLIKLFPASRSALLARSRLAHLRQENRT